ncbi:DUF6053 domain-containing protein [Lysobacter enzymogenes]|uniref:DUF6053 domain-containing protein n=1 Tax=Lysobacter enzymogenes TaxID=69 RepID=UPI003747FE67
MGGSLGLRLFCQVAAIRDKSIGPEGPPTTAWFFHQAPPIHHTELPGHPRLRPHIAIAHLETTNAHFHRFGKSR